MSRKLCILMLAFTPLLGFAQKSTDADQAKITAIEQKFAAVTNFNSPEMTDLLQKYLYDGTTSAIGTFGRLYRSPKAAVIDMTKKPDPTDPDARTASKMSDLNVDVLGGAAVATYKLVNTETGHKEGALNGDYTLTCADSFAKRKGQWYVFASACTPSQPLAQAQWDAVMRMRAAEKQ